MNAVASSSNRLDFTHEEKQLFTKAFGQALNKLEKSTSGRSATQTESNNHFDEAFHKQLLAGLHLQ